MGSTSKMRLKQAAHFRAPALAACFTDRATVPTNVIEYPASSSQPADFPRAAELTASRNGDRGPSAP
jgi:hypothetical protein